MHNLGWLGMAFENGQMAVGERIIPHCALNQSLTAVTTRVKHSERERESMTRATTVMQSFIQNNVM